ncbi:MAG: YicC/YloC family endoribonuclease [Brevinema sp.]
MIRGMTGKASLRFSTNNLDVEMEVRSVNSRYFEFRIKSPTRYSCLEMEARKLISKKLERGKIDLNIRVNEKNMTPSGSLINIPLAKAYLSDSKQLAKELNISKEITLKEILTLPQVLNIDIGEIDEETLNLFTTKIGELIDQMIPMMLTEGKVTTEDINNSLSMMSQSLAFIRERYPKVLEKYKASLRERVLEISSIKASDERLSIEIELFASRTAINEEIVRLGSHIRVMQESVTGIRNDVSSKELDFIAQEMNREVNTIASKSSDFEITEHTIILKREIEKMREQFRNIV